GHGIARVLRRAEMRIEPERREGEFGEIGLAQRSHPGRGEVGDDRRVFFFYRRIGVERRSRGGALASHVDQVFPGDRNAVERPRQAPLPAPLPAGLCFLKRPLAGHDNERRILAVALDAVEKELRDLDRIEGAPRDETADFGGGLFVQVVDHVAWRLLEAEPIAIARSGKQIDAARRASPRSRARDGEGGRCQAKSPALVQAPGDTSALLSWSSSCSSRSHRPLPYSPPRSGGDCLPCRIWAACSPASADRR